MGDEAVDFLVGGIMTVMIGIQGGLCDPACADDGQVPRGNDRGDK